MITTGLNREVRIIQDLGTHDNNDLRKIEYESIEVPYNVLMIESMYFKIQMMFFKKLPLQ
jgi:hypothetical protein